MPEDSVNEPGKNLPQKVESLPLAAKGDSI